MWTELLYYQVIIGKITSKIRARKDRSSLQEMCSEKYVLRIWVKFQNSNCEGAPQVAGEKPKTLLKINFFRCLSSYYGRLNLLGGADQAIW